MKKFIISLAVFGSILSAGLVNMGEAQAAQKTVEYGGSWTYGSGIVLTGKRAYSNLASSKRWHSSSVTIGEGSNMSGDTQPGITSKAERIAGYTATAYCYYNIW